MSDQDLTVRAPAPPPRPAEPTESTATEPPGAGPVLRTLLLGAAVFVGAVLTAGLLAGAAPAVPVEHTASATTAPADAAVPTPSTGQPVAAAPDLRFAYSLIYSGAVALALSVTGTVMVARRRRLW